MVNTGYDFHKIRLAKREKAQRRARLVRAILFYSAVSLVIVTAITLTVGSLYVAIHFLLKFW